MSISIVLLRKTYPYIVFLDKLSVLTLCLSTSCLLTSCICLLASCLWISCLFISCLLTFCLLISYFSNLLSVNVLPWVLSFPYTLRASVLPGQCPFIRRYLSSCPEIGWSISYHLETRRIEYKEGAIGFPYTLLWRF